MTLPTLYKLTRGNKVQQWAIMVNDDQFATAEGLVGGTITYSRPTTCVAKNVGRSNETTPSQQAAKEAQAKWQKKIDQGYGESYVDAGRAKFVEPMLARVYEEEYPDEDLVFPVFVQPKLDGVRCIATKDGLFSRKGKPFVSCRHIEAALKPFFDDDPDLILDGELYNHQLHDDFNAIVGAVKRQKPSDAERADIEATLQFHLYDLPSQSGLPFSLRSIRLGQLLDRHADKDGPLREVETYRVDDLAALDAMYEEFIAQGYEGQMIRFDGPYEFGKRSRWLLKQKAFIDEEFIINDIVEGEGNRAGMMGTIGFLFHDGRRFEGGARGTHAFYREMFEHPERFVGKPATVRYQNLTPKGVPRVGRMIALRDYE